MIRIRLLRSFCFKCILFSEVVLVGCETNSLWSIRPSQKCSDCVWRLFFSSWYSSSVPFALPQKRSHRQQIEIANIHISAEPSLDLSPNILSVSICLQFFLRSFPPSLPPSCSAPIGSRSCSTGRLLAPSHRNLAKAARICPHTSRSLAFCLWKDGTESEGRDKVREREEKSGGGGVWGVRTQLNVQIQMNMQHYG